MNILVLEDDESLATSLDVVLRPAYTPFFAANYDQAVRICNRHPMDLALVDLALGTGQPSGHDFIAYLKQNDPQIPILVESAHSEPDSIVKSLRLGAEDFIEKPFTPDALHARIEKLLVNRKKTEQLTRKLVNGFAPPRIVHKSSSIQNVIDLISRAHSMRILFEGETGVGKTPFALLSNAILSKDTGGHRPFEQLNCACLSRDIFLDELFGHKKGAFTTALSDKKGLVELAEGGDLFLDEIGELSLDQQAMLLTFLDSMMFRRLGDEGKREARVRILCATNRNLRKMVSEGTFRKDLYSRIAQVTITIPPLRERKEDIGPLSEHFIHTFVGKSKPMTTEVLTSLHRCDWKDGNVRELRNVIEFLCIASRNTSEILEEHLPPNFRNPELPERSLSHDTDDYIRQYGLERFLSEQERDILTRWTRNRSKPMEEIWTELGLSKASFYRKLKSRGVTLH